VGLEAIVMRFTPCDSRSAMKFVLRGV